MAKKKVSRKELLKETDEFLSFSSRALLFIRGHARQFKVLGLCLAAAVLVYMGAYSYLNHVHKKGQQAYNRAYYTLLKERQGGAEQKDLEDPGELFQRVVEEYGLSRVSPLALAELGYLKFREKEYGEAVSHYEDYLGEVTEKGPYHTMARMALAACYEEKGELDRAAGILEDILSVSDDFSKEQAMLSLARVYRMANRPEKARETLRSFLETFQNSPFLPLVKSHLDHFPS